MKFKATIDGVALAALVFAVLAISAVSAVAIVSAENLITTNNKALRMQRTVSSLEAIRFHSFAIDSSEQNYIITGKEVELKPYQAGIAEIDAEIAFLAERRGEHPELEKRFVELQSAARKYVADARKGLLRIDLVDQFRAVEIEQRFGFRLVRFEPAADHFLIGIVETIVFQSPLFQPRYELHAIRAGKVEDLLHVDDVAHDARLAHVARDAVEDERVDVRLESMRADDVGDVGLPEFHGDVVRYELALAGIFEELLAEFRARIQRAKDIAASTVEKARDRSQNLALCPLAAAGRAEDQVCPVFHHSRLERAPTKRGVR